MRGASPRQSPNSGTIGAASDACVQTTAGMPVSAWKRSKIAMSSFIAAGA